MAFNVWEWDGNNAWILRTAQHPVRVSRCGTKWNAHIDWGGDCVPSHRLFADRQAAMDWVEAWLTNGHNAMPLPASMPLPLYSTRWMAPVGALVNALIRHLSRA